MISPTGFFLSSGMVISGPASTICGMLPLALGTGEGSEWRNPMGMIAIGGLATSTFLTLLVVPIAYTLIDDAQSWLTGMLRPSRRKTGTKPEEAQPTRRSSRPESLKAS